MDTTIEGIASVSENQAAAIEEIAAGAEEMSAQVDQISSDATSMAQTAEALHVLVDRFTLDDTSPTVLPSTATARSPRRRAA